MFGWSLLNVFYILFLIYKFLLFFHIIYLIMFFSLSTQLYVFSPLLPQEKKNKKSKKQTQRKPTQKKSKQMGINLIGTPLQKIKMPKQN